MAVQISYADFTIIALLLIFGFEGYRSGFFNGILSIGGIFISLAISLAALPYSARFFNFVIELPPNLSILMGFVTIFVICLLLYALFLQWLHTIMKMEVVDWFNRISGTLLGLYKGLLTVSLLALGFSLLPMRELVRTTAEGSLFFERVKYITPLNYNYFRKLVPLTPTFEDSMENTVAMLGQSDEMAASLMESFKSKKLEKSVTTRRQ
ncbi:MAG: CvpA family protein [candidate division KSB1 bacterium]|nr:CvpA family protein [candidate division KSB1 bacterium]MDZ7302784.1 CvpA family protein [candidate division KSB1 bacterium]MDZ7310051.1 CvpA family protein [candidate division KSB1 bacterium]